MIDFLLISFAPNIISQQKHASLFFSGASLYIEDSPNSHPPKTLPIFQIMLLLKLFALTLLVRLSESGKSSFNSNCSLKLILDLFKYPLTSQLKLLTLRGSHLRVLFPVGNFCQTLVSQAVQGQKLKKMIPNLLLMWAWLTIITLTALSVVKPNQKCHF